VKLQWHPATGRRTVASIELSPRSQRALAAVFAVLAFFLALLPLTLATGLDRWRRRAAEEEVAVLNARRREALEVATSALRSTDARLAADRELLGRIAILYGRRELAARAMGGMTDFENPEQRLSAIERRLATLSAVLGEISAMENRNPGLAPETPSVSPLPEASFVVAGPFGWALSKLTGETEFRSGLDLAAPAGRRVRAGADGVVRWAGPYPLRAGNRYSHLGRIVALRHGDRAITVFGFLDAVQVRRGQRVRRGDVLGTVGNDRWAGAPRLRYELWLMTGGGPVPVDPRISMLSYRSDALAGVIARAIQGPPQNFPPLPGEFR
jgi:murein DD-endopeptidase MepM/ murein hydrolase activator NlpD